MIKIRCYTDLGGCDDVSWPGEVIVRPMIGDYVESRAGTMSGKVIQLRVIKVTHSSALMSSVTSVGGSSYVPRLDIKLGE